ncbi:RhoGAP domain containing protein [Trichomonas vaginalis G3]|uniref:RhoGAP domain containing protein n=1 Tax=Trichomonas vaginalis (strain ATCC PRA-98 / G3) TaxID=412133 RepID=A2EBL1_TRIV3|nr:GTPase activator protein [Trichomonas vaginalis G3]EAY09928.1 RhoGAP domain containing protein [Trichomonas vaginalis G3]KAI5523066.1 GTPase activator protein [Trichomonas vaginalis G3]|eukprot:XP_001322151.1 RhoGAP domain containing protein [Trichomonas vaginalis G3]
MSEVEVFKAHFWQQPPEAYQGKIPFIVSDLIAVLKQLGAERVEGVFRLNGSDRQIKELIEVIDNGRIQDWTPYSNVHTIATTLKRYFRAMATIDPIIPFRLYNSIIEIARIQQTPKVISELKNLLKKLDPGRYHTLCFLIKYLNEVSKHDDENQMPAKNIAVCFGPNLISSDRPDSPDALNQSVLVVHVLEDMIIHFEEIFEGIENIDRYNCDPEDILALMVPPLKWSHVVNLMSRNKERMKFKCIQYVPQANMQMSIVNRPKRPPPPILSEQHDNVYSSRSGYAEFYGDAVGAQDLKFFIDCLKKSGNSSIINMLKNIAVSQTEFKIAKPPEKPKKQEATSLAAVPRRSQTVKISSQATDDDIVKPKLTDDEVYVPPPEQNVYRKATLAGRRRPTVRILQD